MGMDPISQLEVYEVTIQISGKANVAAFNAFQDQLRLFIANATTIQADSPYSTAKLQVRVARQAVRPAVQ